MSNHEAAQAPTDAVAVAVFLVALCTSATFGDKQWGTTLDLAAWEREMEERDNGNV